MKKQKINVAIVGLSFGLEFVGIYLKHPNVDKVYVVDLNDKLLKIAQTRYSIPDEQCLSEFDQILNIPEIDAVHLVTPPTTHAPFSIKVLEAGKHCGCTIPMGPLMHPTHAVAPCLMLAGHLPDKVYARGSSRVRKELEEKYGCPFAFEAAFISLKDSDITIEMERFLYGVARSYSECFRIYGENKSFEWQQLRHEDPVLYTRTGTLQKVNIIADTNEKASRGGEIKEERIRIPDYAHLLPDEIAAFTTNTVYNNENTHLSFTQGGGHGGSHPHLVHEFVQSILEDRPPCMDDIMGAYWTGTGICAHQSAMKGGEVISIPRFEDVR